MTENSVGDEPRFASDGVVGDVVVPHHVERVGAGFAVLATPRTYEASVIMPEAFSRET